MNYHQYFPVDVINGPGTRATLFVSGCEHQCRGCYNQSTWNPDNGHRFDLQMQQRVINDLKDSRIKRRGLSLSGGDPLYPENLSEILALVQRVKNECPDKDIWLWTGYRLDELSPEQKRVIDYVDVLIDGKFEQENADVSLVFRGSSNQVIHYLAEKR
ncbi:anaerobic ribonucleoside-triphosphate reductase-activating protein [Shewanella violacea]|uniref:Anaerobic ribonucleoside-triphosphate reductase-activating protein n=1 Tax=Shewanella violacea (strain JCM 10179 / CIP 106290 / LMG 19151 / DSS12) TaxID=637905 RepID=D4ZMK1_SHEVD|nr:anaerobic ribonucleoside-triphosphate reductase-activating protein [Shewanella violacea]BAJ02900.1 anaerobic ribonucleoside-triphosphate reductase activating protein [Shewanella violacea DSS12]